MIRIPLTNGGDMAIDPEDEERVRSRRWRRAISRYDGFNTYYARSGETWAHRFILGLAPGTGEVDHRNGDGLDNRKSNLRLATRSQNNANQAPRQGQSHFKGVYWHAPRSRWRARIQVDGKMRHLGTFTDEEEAARTYDAAALTVWGEYARLNFPDLR